MAETGRDVGGGWGVAREAEWQRQVRMWVMVGVREGEREVQWQRQIRVWVVVGVGGGGDGS